MYFEECERLANRYPELYPVIDKIDLRLNTLPPSSIIVPETWAEVLQCRLNDVRSVFDLLDKVGLIKKTGMLQCERCGSLFREARCPDCDDKVEVLSFSSVEVYRFDRLPEQPLESAVAADSDQCGPPRKKEGFPNSISGEEHEALCEALNSAFPDRFHMERMLKHRLNKNINQIASESLDIAAASYKIVEEARSNGWLWDLVKAAHGANPGNREIIEFCRKVGVDLKS